MKQIAVIGLGRFGMSLAESLTENRCQVLAIDSDMERVKKAQSIVTQAAQLDARDEEALKAVGITEMDTVVVAIGSDVEASMLATMILKEMGVQHVVAKAVTKLHGRFLERIGADKIIYPEIDSGQRLGRNLAKPSIVEQIEFGSEYGVFEIKTPPSWVGKSIGDLGVRPKFGVTILAITSNPVEGEEPSMNVSPNASTKLSENDIILILGLFDEVEKLTK
ncbi:MAG: TrkA family potassium uptake protein [bacterium]